MKCNAGLLCLLWTSLCGPVALAGDATAGSPTTRPAGSEPRAGDFRRGTWTFQLYPSYMHDLSNRGVQTGMANLAVGYYLFDNVALNLEVAAGAFDEPDAQGATGSVGLLLRQHLLNADRFSLYVDVGGGVTGSEHDMPPGATRFNFWMHTGPGLTYKVNETTHLMSGVRYYHLSNASIEGRERNPSGNGIEVYVGVMFTF